jgi:hypothetical protein
MRTSITRVTIGDYIYRMPGFIESVNITVNQDSSWEIEDGSQLPHYLDVAITFKPIHDKIPKRVTDKNIFDGNSIIYNTTGSSVLLQPLNKDFYLNDARTLTQAEIRRMRRKKKQKTTNATSVGDPNMSDLPV